jgi:hypothetical protein
MTIFPSRDAHKAAGCHYRESCHFFTMVGKTERSAHLQELYCEQWPGQCRILLNRKAGKPVPITLGPAGLL